VDQVGGCLIGKIAHMARVIKRRQNLGADIALVVDRRAIAKDFKARSIMPFEQLGDQETHGVAAKIRRQIADAQTRMRIAESL
jgi:hypothetical protein